jgi:hypothetical protein
LASREVAARPVRERVPTDCLKFHPAPPCPILLRPAGGPPPKRPYGRLGVGPPIGQAACGRLLPPWIPFLVRACLPDPGSRPEFCLKMELIPQHSAKKRLEVRHHGLKCVNDWKKVLLVFPGPYLTQTLYALQATLLGLTRQADPGMFSHRASLLPKMTVNWFSKIQINLQIDKF